MDQELLQLLACPKCKGAIDYKPEASAIHCTACNLAYPVRNDIPVMLIDEAEPINDE